MSPPIVARPLTLEPVLVRLAERPCTAALAKHCTRPGCDSAVAEVLARTRRTIIRWKRHGISVSIADEIAARLNAHPGELWGFDVWDHALDVHDEVLEAQRRHQVVAA